MSEDNFSAFELIEAASVEELGRYWEEEKPERFSFEEYGHMLEQAEHGVFTEYGYIYFKNKRIEPFYDGSIPEEYRIGAYARKMLINGYHINIDLSDVREMVSLLRRCSNNINQIAKRTNETRNIYAGDVDDLRRRYDTLWEATNKILTGLAKIK